jgi:hypothetical protein
VILSWKALDRDNAVMPSRRRPRALRTGLWSTFRWIHVTRTLLRRHTINDQHHLSADWINSRGPVAAVLSSCWCNLRAALQHCVSSVLNAPAEGAPNSPGLNWCRDHDLGQGIVNSLAITGRHRNSNISNTGECLVDVLDRAASPLGRAWENQTPGPMAQWKPRSPQGLLSSDAASSVPGNPVAGALQKCLAVNMETLGLPSSCEQLCEVDGGVGASIQVQELFVGDEYMIK